MGSAAFKGSRVNPDGSVDSGTPRTPRTARRSNRPDRVTKDTKNGAGGRLTTPRGRIERNQGVNGEQATPGGKRLDFVLADTRALPKEKQHNGGVHFSDKVAERVSELADVLASSLTIFRTGEAPPMASPLLAKPVPAPVETPSIEGSIDILPTTPARDEAEEPTPLEDRF